MHFCDGLGWIVSALVSLSFLVSMLAKGFDEVLRGKINACVEEYKRYLLDWLRIE